MSIKTYEIHNSYLQDAPDSTGITRMVSEADYLSQLQQTDALQTSLNNIINAFGIKGEGAHSKLVIEYVSGLVAENAALKLFGSKLNEMHNDLNGEGTGIQGKAEIACQQVALEAAMEEFDAIKTPATEAAIAEIKLETIRELVSKISEDLKQKGQSARRIERLDFTWAYIETVRAEMYNANLRAGRKG